MGLTINCIPIRSCTTFQWEVVAQLGSCIPHSIGKLLHTLEVAVQLRVLHHIRCKYKTFDLRCESVTYDILKLFLKPSQYIIGHASVLVACYSFQLFLLHPPVIHIQVHIWCIANTSCTYIHKVNVKSMIHCKIGPGRAQALCLFTEIEKYPNTLMEQLDILIKQSIGKALSCQLTESGLDSTKFNLRP